MNHILIIADIEGTSGCWSDDASAFKTEAWAKACVEMSLDIDAVVRTLFDAGVSAVTIKDFHRTGYNLLRELIDSRARIVHGYRVGPVPGLGDPDGADILMMIGMHAASGSGGFLCHTLTSRIARLEVNGKLMSEAELFSASLAPHKVRPVFFSGCSTACVQAENVLKRITVYPIDKSGGPGSIDVNKWRAGLAAAAVRSLDNRTKPYLPEGPFRAVITMKDGAMAAKKIADRWRLERDENSIFVVAGNINGLYYDLIRIAYLTPLIEKIITPSIFLYNLWGRAGLSWVRGRI
jgi:D-aminopeptidase